ncbi:hypothetical protein RCC89_10805 [Cytophagaceae bacterium ABcell3]|nr:hypothetical protein RCC89_10805 [Cytophagaceae bacterium ABcell3]
MNPIFKKLNYKEQSKVFIINAPESFEENIKSISEKAEVHRKAAKNIEFAIGFATKQNEPNNIIKEVAPQLKGDTIFWVCYPKASSKKYKCEFNRDSGWQSMGEYDLEAVRQVVINEDWSALRFRKVEFIKNLTRSDKMTLSKKSKEKKHQGT